MKLCRYDNYIISSGNIKEGSEDKPIYIIIGDSDIVPSDYSALPTNQSGNLTMWKDFSQDFCYDYSQYRHYVNLDLNTLTWDNCSDEDKDFIIDLTIKEDSKVAAVSDGEKVVYLMGKGNSQGEAILILQKNFAKHHILDAEDCRARGKAVDVYEIVSKYLTLPDATDFLRLVQGLFSNYKEEAIKGTLDGNVGIGFYDFIESTPGTAYEFSGLDSQGFSMNNGDTDMTNFINELMTWFRIGKRI